MTALVTLWLMICSGDGCRIESVAGVGNVMGCQLYAQHIVATWALKPGERIAAWKCEEGRRA